MSSLRRISAGAGANIINLVYVTVITALTVPVLIHAWGVERYGAWVMLTAIPTYLSLSDFGFATAATNDIAMNVARGERDEAVEVLQSVWALNLLVGAITLALAIAAATGMLLLHRSPGLAPTVVALAAYAASCLLSRVILGAFRGTGFYTRGTLLYDGMQFLEGCLSLGVALLGGGFFAVATALLAGRLVSTLAASILLRKTNPWMPLGLRRASKSTLRRLLGPAFASMTIPVALALNMQGIALVVGAMISPGATAVLAATRTVSRIAVQVISAINRAMIPELSAASARGDERARQRLLLVNKLMLLVVALPATIGFAVLGRPVIAIWTSGRIHPPLAVVVLLAVAMGLQCIWFFGTNLLSATNGHGRMAPGLLTCSLAAVLLSLPLSRAFGLTGAAASVVLAEVGCVTWFLWVASGRSSRVGTTDAKAVHHDRPTTSVGSTALQDRELAQ